MGEKKSRRELNLLPCMTICMTKPEKPHSYGNLNASPFLPLFSIVYTSKKYLSNLLNNVLTTVVQYVRLSMYNKLNTHKERG